MNKAVEAYEAMCESGKLGKLKPFDVTCIGWILDDIKGGDVTGTVSEQVANWFKKYGFTVKEEGVGWQISK